MPKNIVLFGATGSIGSSVLNVIDSSKENFNLIAVTCYNNVKKLNSISDKYKCDNLGIAYQEKNKKNHHDLSKKNIIYGINNFDEFIRDEIDIYILAISGLDCLDLSLKIAKSGKTYAIANKETIISFGKILLDECYKNNTKLVPLDSEHNAIHQLLKNNNYSFKDITLTASGGPFLNLPLEKLSIVKPKDAIVHPKWKMGRKISVDSSNLVNKSLELIEAKNLFNLENNEVNAIIHPQAIVHGLVNYHDNSSFAFMSSPNMEVSISSVLFSKKDFISNKYKFNLSEFNKLEFFEIDKTRFPSIKLCEYVMHIGGIAPHLFNYINERLVYLFLGNVINYLDIVLINEKIIEQYYKKNQNIDSPSIQDINEASEWIDHYLKNNNL